MSRTATPSSPRTGSIAHRLMLGTALLALACFGLTATISYWRSSDALLAASRASMGNLARLEAQRIADEMGRAFTTSETLADSLLTDRANGAVDRSLTSEELHRVLQAHPQWTGVGTMWEPQAYDRQDAKFANSEGHDATGRFMVYWAWNDGTPMREPLRD